MRYLLAVFLTCCACSAQSISVGAIGGARVTADILSFPEFESNDVRNESKLYDVGPAIEIGLNRRFAIEFDAVYHRQGYFFSFCHDTNCYIAGERDNGWEFPLLFKYKPRFRAVHAFVEAGVAPRVISGSGVEIRWMDVLANSPRTTSSYSASYSPTVGLVAGGGLEFNRGHLRFAPQVRYTRWATAPIGTGFFGGTFSSNQNQFGVLLGIGWKVK